VQAIRTGDLASLRRQLTERPGLASDRIVDAEGTSRTPLHVVTDWPGYWPNGPEVVQLLVEAGADLDAVVDGGSSPETPLHWAASSDDVEVAAALIDAGANIEAPGASIAGGGPIDDAVGYGFWHVARLLVARGARVDSLWQAAALGQTDRVEQLLDGAQQDELDEALWQACHGGQRRTAEYLLGKGANIDAVPGYSSESALDIAASLGTRRDMMITWLRELGATSTRELPPG